MGTLFTGLGVAAALSVTDIIPVHQGGARAVGLTGAQLLTLVGTAYVPLAGGATMTGALTIASGTLTASAPALNITQTWNNAGVQFNALLINATDSASSSISTFFEMQIAGTVRHLFTKGGRYTGASAVLASTGASSGVTSTGVAINNFVVGIRNSSLAELSWTSGNLNGTVDVALYRDAAATLALRFGTAQQTFRLYNTYTDTSNYERLTLTGVAGTSVNITAETLGTGGDNLDIVLTPAGTGSVKIPVAGLALSGVNANFLLGTTGTSRLTFAGTLSVINKSASADLYFGESTDTGAYVFRGTGGVNVTGAFQVTEMTAPAAPSTNSVRIYAEDNGAGKTRLMALFATGVAQQIAIEP